MIQASVFTALSEDAEIAAIVEGRIYPVRLPRNSVVPAVVYQTPNIVPVNSMGGDSGIDNGAVEIVCWASNYTVAHELAHNVRNAMASASGITVLTESLNDAEDEETHNFAVIVTFRVWSVSGVGSSGGSVVDAPISTFYQDQFTGDNVTTEFDTTYKFRSGSLILFKNGRLMKKGEEGAAGVEYWENATLTGFVLRDAPEGGGYTDELLAYYARN